MRAILRRLIVWALGGAPPVAHDAAGLDRIAAEAAANAAAENAAGQ
jgi:hypothetical protein